MYGLINDMRRAYARFPHLGYNGCVLTIALGIGVNTGIFTVLNGLVLRDLPALSRSSSFHSPEIRGSGEAPGYGEVCHV
jgi:hypothetical protein